MLFALGKFTEFDVISGLHMLSRELCPFLLLTTTNLELSFISATPNGHEDIALVLETESPVPALQSTPARRPSEQERREFLESDKQIEKVEKYRVFCRACQTWVTLGQTSAYATGSWTKHKVRCSDMCVTLHSFPVSQN